MTLRSWLALGLATIVLVWPPIHMIGSKLEGFTPWKLAGWGMYAAPFPEAMTRVHLFAVVDGKLESIVLSDLDAARAGELRRLYDRVVYFRREDDLHRLATRLREWSPPAGRPERILASIQDRRIDVLGRRLYQEETRYLYEDGRLRVLDANEHR